MKEKTACSMNMNGFYSRIFLFFMPDHSDTCWIYVTSCIKQRMPKKFFGFLNHVTMQKFLCCVPWSVLFTRSEKRKKKLFQQIDKTDKITSTAMYEQNLHSRCGCQCCTSIKQEKGNQCTESLRMFAALQSFPFFHTIIKWWSECETAKTIKSW